MVRELGMNPKKFSSLYNTKHFKKNQSDNVRSIEKRVSAYNKKRQERNTQRSKEEETDQSEREEIPE